ncbi:MAG: sugar phosphate nucleotidyltransferase [Promethearchaeota archaeon]
MITELEATGLITALILAGGFGTRLRPLTCTRPKPLFPLGNRPLSEILVERLAKSGVERIIFAVNYQAELIMQYFGTGDKWGIDIRYAKEKRPLGTGGPIKNAQHLLDDSPFFVLNGDVISLIDFEDMLNFHMQREDAFGTIALCPVEDPSRYGAVELDDAHRILKFVEKPPPGEEPSNLINAGAYVLDPEVFKYIPDNKPFSIERKVFPLFADQMKLYGYRYDDLWLDMGKPIDYLQANKFALDHFLEKEHSSSNKRNFISSSANTEEPVFINSSVAIGKNVKIARDTHIGPYVCIGDDVTIGQGCRIENSVIFPDVQIDSFSSINNCIVGEAATLGRWVKIEGLTIIGDYCTIKDNVTLTSGVTICPWKTISESITTPRNIM